MIWTDLIIGAILMLTGWAVYKFPMLISGVNTMSKKRLAKVNLEGLKLAYRNVFLICGGAMLLFGGLSTLVQIPMDVHFIVLFVVMLASDDKHENMVKINTEVFDSYKGKPVTSVFIGIIFIAYSLSPM